VGRRKDEGDSIFRSDEWRDDNVLNSFTIFSENIVTGDPVG
jgi:hypothetical protein